MRSLFNRSAQSAGRCVLCLLPLYLILSAWRLGVIRGAPVRQSAYGLVGGTLVGEIWFPWMAPGAKIAGPLCKDVSSEAFISGN